MDHLDPATLDAARRARDPAYDGVFFTAVKTTKIYCRPVCPVKPALSRNVTFYPSAAAAERAGYRPCLRCRPETAPGSPPWRGTATTVARASSTMVFSILTPSNGWRKNSASAPAT